MQRWVFSGQRWTVEVVLQYIGRRARSDQYRVLIDGREWMPCAGVADTLAHLRRDVLPRTASKRQCDEMAREDYRSARQAAEDGTAARNSVKCRHG